MVDFVDGGSYDLQISPDVATRTIDIPSRQTGFGGADVSTYTIINGLSMIGGLSKMPVNTDHQGYTFFTRPQLNLSYDNVIGIRKMTPFADQRLNNASNAIRCLLNPPGLIRTTDEKILYTGIGINSEETVLDVRSDIVDDSNPFIPILTNNLLTISGFPDFAPDVYTSPEDITKAAMSWVDDRPVQHGPFDCTANFQNIDGNFILDMFGCWVAYEAHVAQGSMVPFPFNNIANRIDYNTKIYRFKMDRTKRFIQGIAATIAFPVVDPIGATFNFNHEDRLNMEGNQVSMSFRCMGVEYNDPILIKEFNRLVTRFNPDMDPVALDRNQNPIPDPLKMHYLTDDEKLIYNFKAYPFINLSSELQWYTPIDIYNQIQELINRNSTTL